MCFQLRKKLLVKGLKCTPSSALKNDCKVYAPYAIQKAARFAKKYTAFDAYVGWMI